MRIAVVGLGDVAPVHLAAITGSSTASLVGVCNTDDSRHGVAPGVPFFTDVSRMVAEAKPDLVHVCLPHHLHYSVAKQLLEAGVHVLCEKPVAHTPDEVAAFVALADHHPDRVVAMCLQNRMNASTRRLDYEITSRSLAVLGVRASVAWHRTAGYFSSKPWRGSMATAGGGALINQSIHTLDLLLHFGGAVERVSGSLSTLSGFDIDVEDTATLHLRFASGASGLFFATNVNHRNDSVEMTVSTSGGDYLIRDGRLLFRDGVDEVLLVEDAVDQQTKSYYGPGHRILIDELYAAVANGSGRYVHIRDAQPVMQVIEAARISSSEGRTVFLLPSLDDQQLPGVPS